MIEWVGRCRTDADMWSVPKNKIFSFLFPLNSEFIELESALILTKKLPKSSSLVQISKTSSTYLSRNGGADERVERSSHSKNSMYRPAKTGYSGLPIAIPRLCLKKRPSNSNTVPSTQSLRSDMKTSRGTGT